MEPLRRVEFFVPGVARPKGSRRSFVSKTTGKMVSTDSSPKTPKWEAYVRQFAYATWRGVPSKRPFSLTLTFHRCRPAAQHVAGNRDRPLKSDMPLSPASKRGDLDKLARTVLDGLTHTIYVDDGQVVWLQAQKVYDTREGVTIVAAEQSATMSEDIERAKELALEVLT